MLFSPQSEPCTALSVLFTLYSVWHQAPADWIIWDQKTGWFFLFLFLLHAILLWSIIWTLQYCFQLKLLFYEMIELSNSVIQYPLFAEHFIWLCISTWCSWRREDAQGQLWSTANSSWGIKKKNRKKCEKTSYMVKYKILINPQPSPFRFRTKGALAQSVRHHVPGLFMTNLQSCEKEFSPPWVNIL